MKNRKLLEFAWLRSVFAAKHCVFLSQWLQRTFRDFPTRCIVSELHWGTPILFRHINREQLRKLELLMNRILHFAFLILHQLPSFPLRNRRVYILEFIRIWNKKGYIKIKKGSWAECIFVSCCKKIIKSEL